MNKKELAKFFSGVAVNEAIGHTVLAMGGLFPLTIFGLTVTPAYNSFIIFAWTAAAAFLIHYAWFKK